MRTRFLTAVVVGAASGFFGGPVEAVPPNPVIHVMLTGDVARAVDFTPNASATFTIYASEAGAVLYGPATRTTDGTGSAFLDRSEHGVDLAPGRHVVITDNTSGVTKAVTLVAVTIDSVDQATNIIAGTAPPGIVHVYAEGPGPSWPAAVDATADGTGAWSVDFDTVGFDIAEGIGGKAHVDDPEGDITVYDTANPNVHASLTSDWVNLHNWLPGSTLTVDIGGTTRTVTADARGFASIQRPTHGVDLVPGTLITATDGAVTKTNTLGALTLDTLDAATDVASGTTAPPGRTVQVTMHGDGGAVVGSLNTTADAAGVWSVDFTGVVDVTPGMGANAGIADAENDNTVTEKFLSPQDSCLNQPDFTDPNAFRGAIAGLGTPIVVDFEDVDASPANNSLEGRSQFDENTYADRGATFSNPNGHPLYVAPGGLGPHCDPGQDGCPVWNESNSLSVGEFPFPAEVVDNNDDDLFVRLHPPVVAVGFTLVDNASHRCDEFIEFIDADGLVIEKVGLPFDFEPFRAFAGIVSQGRPISAINIVENADDGDDVCYDDFILVPPPTPDFTPSVPHVTPEPVRTDYGTTPAHTTWTRTIDVDVSNVGGAAGEAGLEVWVRSNTDGTRTLVGTARLQLGAGRTARETFNWNGLGIVGDVTVEARTCSQKDRNRGNNRSKASAYVVVGGTGFGITGPVTFGGRGRGCEFD